MTQSTMPLYYLLIPYSLIILAFLVFAIIDLLHIVLHSEINKTSVFVTLVFLVGFFASLFGSYIKLSEISWQSPILSIGVSENADLFK